MRQFAIIGLGSFGRAAGLELLRMGNTVIGVDIRDKPVNELSDDFSVTAVADATDEHALEELDIAKNDAVLVAIGDSFEASILCVLLLKSLKVKEIWVKATNKPHHTILSRLGVNRIIHPEEEMGIRVAQLLNYPMINQYLSIGNGSYIVEIEINEKCHQRSINELLGKDAENIDALLIRRNNELIKYPKQDLMLQIDDSLIVSGKISCLKRIANEFED